MQMSKRIVSALECANNPLAVVLPQTPYGFMGSAEGKNKKERGRKFTGKRGRRREKMGRKGGRK